MVEHEIRLRGGWVLLDRDRPTAAHRIVSLPTRFARGSPRRIQLVRRFGRPTHDPESEQVALRLEAVPGLVRLALNGREHPVADRLELENLALGPRNELVLDVDGADSLGDRDDWGRVALVVTTRPQAGRDPLA